jgi:hypothetical protein
MFSMLKRLFLSTGAKPSSSRRTRVCRPTLESLEDRRLLATNLFGVGGDWRVYEQRLDNNGHASTSWFSTSSAGQIISNVSMSTDAYSYMHLFGVGADGQVYEQDLDPFGNALSGWYSTAPGQIVSSVSVSPDGKHLFGVGRTGLVYEQDLSAYGRALTGWFATSSAGQIVSDVCVSPDSRHLFGVGGDGRVYEQTLDAVSGHATTSWIATTSGGTIVSDVSVSPDARHLFGVGGDGRVYEQTLDASGNPLTNWIPTTSGGYIASNVTVGTDVYGRIELFGVGGNGQVYMQFLDASGNPVSDWNSTGQAGVTSDVSLVTDANGGKHLFGVGRDRRVYEEDFDATYTFSSGWFATSSTGGIYSDVSASGSGGAFTGVSVLGSLTCEPAAGRLYSPASGTLFGPAGPSYLDVQQGNLGDCWLMASLAEVAARNTCDIGSMITPAGTTWVDGDQVSLYNVRLYDGSGVAHTITVDGELPMGGAFYDHPVGGSGAINGSANPVLWAALVEKAYAVANRYGFVTTKNPGFASYRTMDGGDAAPALQAITGQSASDNNINPSDAVSAWNQGKLVVLCTTSPQSSYIEASHDYALVSYDATNATFTIYNPWGTDSSGWAPGHSGTKYGLFWANAAALSQNFAKQSVGAGAAPGGPEAPDNTAAGPGTVFAGLGVGGGGANALLASTPVSGSTSTPNVASTGPAGAGGGPNEATASPALTSHLGTPDRADGTPGTSGVDTPGKFAFDALAVTLFDNALTADDKLVL